MSLDRQRSRGLYSQGRAAERHALTERRERGRAARGILGAGGRSVAGSLGAVGTYAGTALGLAGTFAVGSAIQTEISERAQASKLAIQAKRPEMKGALLDQARGVQGFTGGDALTALEGFITKTGDIDAARGSLQGLATLALATSSDLGEMGEAAGQAFNVIRDTIKDPKAQMDALQEVMASLAAQGTLGAVEIRDMASELGGLGAATRAFKGGPVELLKTVGAMAQTAVARGGAGSAAEATSSVVRFASDLTKKPAQQALQGMNINAFADKGRTQLRSPQELMADILDKTKGDLTKVNDIFGEYGVRAVRGFSPLYTEAEKKQKGTGRAAVLAEFEKFTGAASSPAEMRNLANSRLQDEDKKFLEAKKAFNVAIGTELLPAITKMIPEFVKLIPHLATLAQFLGKLVEAVARDPVGSLFKAIAVKMGLEMASAGIGNAVKNKLLALLGGASGGAAMPIPGGGASGGAAMPIPGGGAGGGFMGKPTMAGALGAAGIGLGIGSLVAAGISTAGVANIEKNSSDIDAGGELVNRIRESAGAGDFAGSADMIGQLQEMSRKAKDTSVFEDFMGLFGASNAEEKQKSLDTMVQDAQSIQAKAVLEAQQQAGVAQIKAATDAGEAFKVAVADAAKALPPNRTNTPTAPVP